MSQWPEYMRDNKGMVEKLAKKYANHSNDREDARQLAYMALERCHRNYDPSRGVKFSSLAYQYIENELCKWWHTNNKAKRMVLVDDPIEVEARAEPDNEPADATEVDALLAYILKGLRKSEARLFKLYREHGGVREAGAAGGVTYQRVSQAVVKAKALAAEWLEGQRHRGGV